MKGRFRILKTGIALHGIENTDKIWLTCCGLHNFLLEEDDADTEWDVSNYLGADGHHDVADITNHLGACTRVDVDRAQREFDTSGMGVGSDLGVQSTSLPAAVPEEGENVDVPGPTQVCKMDLETFKSKLINHFDIMWKQRRIVWPSRDGSNPAPCEIIEHER